MRRRTLMLGSAGVPSLLNGSNASRSYRFEYWDVFTSQRFRGNPLCVFPDAEGLGAETMLEIARESNLSETTFVFRRSAAEEHAKGIRTRIFTPGGELDFAGHPTLGTAMSLWRRGVKQVALELNAARVAVDFRDEGAGRVYGEMAQPDPIFAEKHAASAIARLWGIAAGDIDEAGPIVNVSTGRPNLIVMLRSLRVLRSLRPDWPGISEYFRGGDPARGFYFLTREVEGRNASFHARKLTPRTEDPVTGSAAGSAIAWLVREGLVESGQKVVIEQGVEVHRPGQMFVSASGNAAAVANVRVGGYAVKAWQGILPS